MMNDGDRKKFLEKVEAGLITDPTLCEDLIRLAADSLSKYRERCQEKSTALADNAINTLSCFIDYGRYADTLDHLLDAVIHECRSLNMSHSIATNEMVKSFAEAVHSKNPTPEKISEYLNFVLETRGSKARTVAEYVLRAFGKKQ